MFLIIKKGRKESPLFSSWWLFRGILMAPPFCQTPRPFISLWAFNNAMLMRTTTVAKLIMNGLRMESCYGDQLDKGGSGLHTRVWDEKTQASCMRVDSSDSLALISFVQSGWQTLKKGGGVYEKKCRGAAPLFRFLIILPCSPRLISEA